MRIYSKLLAAFLILCIMITAVKVLAEEKAALPDENVELADDANIKPDTEENYPFDSYEEDTPTDTDLNIDVLPDEEYVDEDDDELSSEKISECPYFDLLKAVGMDIEDENNTYLSREKAAQYLAMLTNIQISTKSDVTYFKDVSLQNEYLSYINLGCESGYLSGTGNGMFNPKRGITPQEFATIVLRIAGYKDYADVAGGSLKYIELAKRYDLLEGVSTGLSKVMHIKDALTVIKNALELPVCKMVSVSDGNLGYSIDKDYTVSEHIFNIKIYSGIVYATADAALESFSAADEDIVGLSINGNEKTYKCSAFNTEDYLGQNVYCYINDNDEVVFLESRTNIDKINIGFEKIENVSADRTQITYSDQNGKTKKAKINYDAVFIWNGKQYNSVTADELNKPNTRLQLVDTDNDGNYEIVYVEHNNPIVAEVLPSPIYTLGVGIKDYPTLYPEALVENIEQNESLKSYVASERSSSKSVELDDKSDDYRLNIIMDGKKIGYKDIMVNDLLSVCESIDGEKKTVYVSRNTVDEKITSIDITSRLISTESGKQFTYTFDMGATSLLGKKVTLYIDNYGYASAYRFSSTDELVYGYLMKYASKGSELSENWAAKIYTMDKKIEVFDFADKFQHNDERCTGKEFGEYFNTTGHQLVKYQLDSSGKIKKVYTSFQPQGYSLKSEKPIFTQNEHYNDGSGVYGVYKSTSMELEYNCQSAERLLVVCDDDGNIADDRVFLVSSFLSDIAQDIRVYDAAAGKIAKFLVCTVNENELEQYMGLIDCFFVIGDIYKDINGTVIKGMRRGSVNKPFDYKYYEGDGVSFEGLKKGDIIKIAWYETTNDGRYVIQNYKKVFTLNSDGNEAPAVTICADWDYNADNMPITNGRISYNKQIYGTIASMTSLDVPKDFSNNIEWNTFVLTIQPEGTYLPEDCYTILYNRIVEGAQRVFKYNCNRKTLEVLVGTSLKPGDRIFVATNYFASSFIVIYE